MPKKIQHKGKPKSATEKYEDFVFREKSKENIEEAYTTVGDFEFNKKDNKRLMKNNWSKYESVIADFENSDDSKEFPKTDDFTYLIKTASSDCSHFQFSSEKEWNKESTVSMSEIFNLDLNVLSGGLACLPFYERIGLGDSRLSAEDKEKFDKEAEDSLKEYNLHKEKNKKDKNEHDIKNLSEPIKVDNNLGENKPDQHKKNAEEIQITDKSQKSVSKKSKKLFFTENDENLEDWLDSVLGD